MKIAFFIIMIAITIPLLTQNELHRAFETGDESQITNVLKKMIRKFTCNGERVFEYICDDEAEYACFIDALGEVSGELAPLISHNKPENIASIVRELLSRRDGIRFLIDVITTNDLRGESVDFLLDALERTHKWMSNKLNRRFFKLQEKAIIQAQFLHEFNIKKINSIYTGHSIDSHCRWHEPRLVDFLNEQDSNGQTVLHKAALFGSYNLLRLLVFLGAKRDIQDKNGDTPAQVVIKRLEEVYYLDNNINYDHAIYTKYYHIIHFLNFVGTYKVDEDYVAIRNYENQTQKDLIAAGHRSSYFGNFHDSREIVLCDEGLT